MERAKLEVLMRDKIQNERNHNRIKITGIAHRISKLEWQQSGPIARRTDNWRIKVLEWQPPDFLGERPMPSIGLLPDDDNDDS